MHKIKLLCVFMAALTAAGGALAQAWPTRPVKIVVSFPPGTTPDTVARVVAPRMQEALGQPVIVENRAGAGGNVAADAVAKSPADGYTLLVSTNAAVATNKVLYDNLPYDPERDLATISLLATAAQALVVRNGVPVKTFKEFLEYARTNPGRMSYGTTGSGSAAHLTMELLKADAKVFIVHIPYRGFPQAVTDMLAGNVETMFAIIPGVLPHIKAGKMTPLAVTALKRSELLPKHVTMASLIFGLDSDTMEIFDIAHDFLTRSKAAFFQACAMTPYPGTPVFQKLRNEGRILTDDWTRFDASKVIIRPEKLSPEELLEGYNKLKWHFYSNKSILHRSYPNIKNGISEALLYFTLNRGYQKKNNRSVYSQVYQNPAGSPVDFDVAKYVQPLVNGHAHRKVGNRNLVCTETVTIKGVKIYKAVFGPVLNIS